MTTHVSLAIITLNAENSIGRCLKSIKDYVEEVCILDTGSTDKTIEEVLSVCPNAKIQTFIDPNRHPVHGWTSDFGRLRNLSLAMCSHDAILWLDSDDTVVNPAGMRAAINDFFGGKAGAVASALSMRYEYAFDKQGHCTVAHPRHRVLRKGYFEWEGVVHEDVRPLRPCRVGDISEADACIRHERTDAASPESAERNLWILEQYQARGGAMNDRTWQNVGTSLVLLGRYAEAVAAFEKGIACPHNNPECDFITFMRWGDAECKAGHEDAALVAFGRAQTVFPDRKAPYLAMAEILVGRQQAKQALQYVEIAENVNGDKDGFVWNPTVDVFVPAMLRAKALFLLEDYAGSLKQYELLAKEYPDEDTVIGPRDRLIELLFNHKLYESFNLVADSLVDRPADRATLFSIAPHRLKTFPSVAKASLPLRPTDKKTAVIYCGSSHVTWGHDSLETGIGGSEEAVILLSRELVAKGWHVEVYAFPSADQMGTDPYGVVWAPYYAFDAARHSEVYIGWRQYMKKPQVAADFKALWLHDSIIGEYFSEDMVACWDAIFCLSEQHSRDLPAHAKSKLVLTANGLSSAYLVNGRNLPASFIYASSPDRGLLPLLKEWPKIRAAIPNATLDVYYGFTRNYLSEAGRNADLRKLRDDILARLDQPGVFMHGMVGQRELAHAFARCGFWLYPTAWSETSCITAQKAQALGAIPITSRHKDSALPETCGKFDLGPPARDGSIYDQPEWLSEWTETVIRESGKDHVEHRAAMKEWSRKEFSWQAVAEQWSALFSERLNQQRKTAPEKVLSL